MALYHYAIMDYQSGFIKLGQINAVSIDDAEEHLIADDISVLISTSKIPVYKNKTPLSTDNPDNA